MLAVESISYFPSVKLQHNCGPSCFLSKCRGVELSWALSSLPAEVKQADFGAFWDCFHNSRQLRSDLDFLLHQDPYLAGARVACLSRTSHMTRDCSTNISQAIKSSMAPHILVLPATRAVWKRCSWGSEKWNGLLCESLSRSAIKASSSVQIAGLIVGLAQGAGFIVDHKYGVDLCVSQLADKHIYHSLQVVPSCK